MKIKVCGLTDLVQIHELISMKVDFLGFIFYQNSPRFVRSHLTLEEISEVAHAGKVGVFVNEEINKIVEISEKAGLNIIQLHGDEDENFLFSLKSHLSSEIKIIKVLRIGSSTADLQYKISNSECADYLLFDTDSAAFGGAGKAFDWHILNNLEILKPYFLSGGISLENVSQISKLKNQPFALDINSKFETAPGVKNLEKIKELYEKL